MHQGLQYRLLLHNYTTVRNKTSPDSPAPTGTTVKRRGGRRLILSSVPGGVAPPPSAAVSPATLVDGKATGSMVGFRVSRRSRQVIDELVDAEGVSQRTWFVQLIDRYLVALGEPPLQEPLFEGGRGPSRSARPELVAAIEAHLNAATSESRKKEPQSRLATPRRPAAQTRAASGSSSQDARGDIERWMKEHAPRKGLDLFADDVERLIGAGYDWDQVRDYLRTVKQIEITPKALWAWWQKRGAA